MAAKPRRQSPPQRVVKTPKAGPGHPDVMSGKLAGGSKQLGGKPGKGQSKLK